MSSSNYPEQHGNHEACTVTILEDVFVTASPNLDIEWCCDRLVIGSSNVRSSDNIPSTLSLGDVVSWSSDDSITRSGWQLCFSPFRSESNFPHVCHQVFTVLECFRSHILNSKVKIDLG